MLRLPALLLGVSLLEKDGVLVIASRVAVISGSSELHILRGILVAAERDSVGKPQLR